DGEVTDAPRLTWISIGLSTDRSGLIVVGATLNFLLFDTPWSISLDDLLFSSALDAPAIEQTQSIDTKDAGPLVPTEVRLNIDPKNRAYAAALTLAARFTGQSHMTLPGLQALYTFSEGEGTTIHDVSGVGAPLDLIAEDSKGLRWSADGLTIVA